MIFIGSAMTENYYQRALPFFNSFGKVSKKYQSDVICFFVGIDFNPIDLLKHHDLDRSVISKQINSASLFDPSNPIIQHGDFLKCHGPWRDNDYILWVDCDAYFQREILSIDKQHFSVNKICAGVLPNKGEESLRHESFRLGGVSAPEEIASELGFNPDILKKPTLNTGCVGASVQDWKRMRELYNEKSQVVKDFFPHYARQQFLMSLITYSGFNHEIMPKYTHCDGHYCVPDNIIFNGSEWLYNDGDTSISALYCHGGYMMK
jgi:hypothetical protein